MMRAVVVAVIAVCLSVTGLVMGVSAQAATVLPSDPKASGYIGLCDSAGRNVVGGDINATPFVWKAVASAPPPASYQGTGQNAVLSGYQPRPDTLPAYWSGMSLTGASFYTNAKAPTVQATYADPSLAQFIATYPPQLNGLYVLRMAWGKQNYGLYNATYPTTTIQVQGSRWHVVSGGTVDCAAAKATSLEQLTGVVSKADVVPRAPSSDLTTTAGATPRPIVGSPSAVASASGSTTSVAPSAGGGDQKFRPASASSSSSTSSGHGWVLWTLVAIVVVLVGALVLALRRRTPVPTVSPSADHPKD